MRDDHTCVNQVLTLSCLDGFRAGRVATERGVVIARRVGGEDGAVVKQVDAPSRICEYEIRCASSRPISGAGPPDPQDRFRPFDASLRVIGLATIHNPDIVGADESFGAKAIVVIVIQGREIGRRRERAPGDRARYAGEAGTGFSFFRDRSRGPHPAAREATGSAVRRMPGRSTAASRWDTFDLTTPVRAVARSKLDAVTSEGNSHKRKKNHRNGIRAIVGAGTKRVHQYSGDATLVVLINVRIPSIHARSVALNARDTPPPLDRTQEVGGSSPPSSITRSGCKSPLSHFPFQPGWQAKSELGIKSALRWMPLTRPVTASR
jgi:hypothetical protein